MCEHQRLQQDWLRCHQQNDNAVNLSRFKRVYVKGRVFYLMAAVDITTHKYRTIYGYCIVANKLCARQWYYSRSEAAWRAFTGFRQNGAWMKGAEDAPEHHPSGYVFECMVYSELAVALDDFWNDQQANGDLVSSDKLSSLEPQDADYTYAHTVNRHCGVANDYNRERTYLRINHAAGDRKNQELERDSVYWQEKFKSDQPDALYNNLQHSLLFDRCIQALRQAPEKQERLYHPILQEDCVINRYLVSNGGRMYLQVTPSDGAPAFDCFDISDDQAFYFDIVHARGKTHHQYHDKIGNPCQLVSNVSWVRNVFLANTQMTSFGTPSICPINLACLVQKPIDYTGQISGSYRRQVKLQPKYGSNYTLLSLFNELSSPLIKAYKKQYNLTLLSELNVQPSLAEVQSMLNYSISVGCDHYLNIHKHKSITVENKKGSHGSDGIKRCEELQKAIITCNTIEELDSTFNSCFVKNKIGSFSGGFFSSINSNSTSLFTCVAVAVLTYCQYINYPQGVLIKMPTIHKMLSKFHLLTPHVRWSSLSDLDEFITSKAKDLLKAIS